MAVPLLLGLAVAFIATSLLLLSTNKRRRNIVLERISFHRRRNSAAATPPRSLSPGKKNVSAQSEPEYTDVLPPSRRDALKDAATSLAPEQRGKLETLSKAVDGAPRHGVPLQGLNEKSGSGSQAFQFTSTDISLAEVEALGDFPDYAALSGVPLPSPYKDFDITKALPRPYRPFRWAYHQTMSLTKMEPDWWLELENTYVTRIQQRRDLFAQYGKAVLDHLPGSELACKELMEMALQFLCSRYPQYFSLSSDKRILHNRILGTETDLKAIHPLHVLLENVPEDFGIMLRDPTNGAYYLRAGVICSSLGWNLGLKVGKRLHEIHEPVPDYKEKMQFSMDRFFSKMPTDRPIQRGSWGLEIDEPLFMPPGDPHEAHRLTQHADLPLSRCNLRVDWQTLRRLPLSGAIVFNFKALFTPISEFRDEPYVPSLVRTVLLHGKENLMKYKSTWHVHHVVLPALEQWEAEQREKGLTDPNWTCHTLEDTPYFPGWEEKWHRQQGF
ncbi:alpha-1,2-mannosyltransferase [Xylona heveae TC161]|uniref:Alpha-1,2-mannosyltransferase n=1 Tax=Xylona heveae (strain CBS 132557 / TC161) TaxID=1328760 RepID=A0A165H2Q8_XYLHT|nr:alpha-1,2-mannosyltransferase [Xylona heveae TC161]KZF22904.1 alpha-1,2-mannosyltransferase [Xylona heveae TC161]